MRILLVFVWFLLLSLNTYSQKRIKPSFLKEDDQLGHSISICNQYAAVSAKRADVKGKQNGAVYIYKIVKDKWKKVQKIVAPDSRDWDYFGNSISLNDKTLAIGCSFDDKGEINNSNEGSVYIYKLEGNKWKFKTLIFAPDAKVADWFGHSVSLEKNLLLVGARGCDNTKNGDINNNSGAAYLFKERKDDWHLITKITSDRPDPSEEFGYTVQIKNANLYVSGPRTDYKHGNEGALYVYKLLDSKAHLIQKIKNQNGQKNDLFSQSFHCSGNNLLLQSHGKARLYEKKNGKWIFTTILNNNDRFYPVITNVKIEGNYALVGTRLFEKVNNNWSEKCTLTPNDMGDNSFYGWSIDMNKNKILIGAPRDDKRKNESGAIYYYNY